MSYQNTGGYRCTTCTVDKTDSAGNSLAGYPKQYLITDAIPNTSYVAITVDDLRIMSDTEYQNRLTAFYNYIETEESGLDANAAVASGYEPYGTDTTLCPISVTVDPGEIQTS